jgi:hypothetical protein
MGDTMSLSDAIERVRAIDPERLLEQVRGMTQNEAIAFVLFLVFTVGFFLWVLYLAIRR